MFGNFMYVRSGSVYVVAYLWFFIYLFTFGVYFLGGIYDKSQGATYVFAYNQLLSDIFAKDIP
jgi:hypothetical protein